MARGRTALLAGLAGMVLAFDWLRLERPQVGSGTAVLVVILAIAPALVRRRPARVAAAVGATVVATSLAFRVSPFDMRPGPHDYLGPLASRFVNGLLDFYDFRMPIDPHGHMRMHGVLLVAVFAFALPVALAVAARRAMIAVVVFLVGAGWPVTLLAGGHEVARGAVILATALALLAGLGERPGKVALGAAAAVIVPAVMLSGSAAVAKNAFLDWQKWDFYNRPQKPVGVEYVWNGDYSGIHFPNKETTVLEIEAPSRPLYWRATTLDLYAGGRWAERLRTLAPADLASLVPAGAADQSRWVTQRVEVKALRDRHLVGASMPMDIAADVVAPFRGDGVAVAAAPLPRGTSYVVRSYAPQPTPAQLVLARATYPRVLTRAGGDLDLAGVTMPPFGARGRDARLEQLLALPQLEAYRGVYDQARSLTGRTTSPYGVAVALETWLRVTGDFRYDEQPPSSGPVPPLAAFLTQTKAGYCQHFAGAMALQLRLLGIPARVAAGFVSGTNHNGTWRVTDHDAHTWVEAWFPRYGWLPFDPTPGRGQLAASYSAASKLFDAAAAAALIRRYGGGVRVTPLGRITNPIDDRHLGNPIDLHVPEQGSFAVPREGSGVDTLLELLGGLVGGTCVAIVGVKTARRRLRYVTREPRRVAGACARDLADFLLDQRIPVERSLTLQELGRTVEEQLAIDARPFAAAATAARFGPPELAPRAAGEARLELRRLKRDLRTRLDWHERVRGLFSLRSLGFS